MIGDSAFWFLLGIVTTVTIIWGFHDLDETDRRYKEWEKRQKKSDSLQARKNYRTSSNA